MITNEQRLFQIEQSQRKLIESIKETTNKPEGVVENQNVGKIEENNIIEPIFPIKSNYIMKELI